MKHVLCVIYICSYMVFLHGCGKKFQQWQSGDILKGHTIHICMIDGGKIILFIIMLIQKLRAPWM